MSKGLRVYFRETKVIIYGGITKDSLSKSKVHPCRVCGLRV